MRLHERTLPVSKAELEFGEFFLKWEQKHDLTYGEMFGILGRQVSNLAKYMVRGERHPDDPNKKGDEA